MIFGKKKGGKGQTEVLSYDRNEKTPVIHCSICNGEQVAGFKDRKTGHFREITLIRTPDELETFMKQCGVTQIPREY